MGRARRKYKAKPTVVTDETEQKKIKLDLDRNSLSKYDKSNALVIPSQKRTTKKLRNKDDAPAKILSKRKRKHLEKIVDKKKKKLNRAQLLASLQEVKADPKDLEMLTQLQATQTLGRKRYSSDTFTLISKSEVEKLEGNILSSIKGKRRKLNHCVKEEICDDYNVVKLGEQSTSEESELETESELEAEFEEPLNHGAPVIEAADCKPEETNTNPDSTKAIVKEGNNGAQQCIDVENSSVDTQTTASDGDKPLRKESKKLVTYVSLNRSELVQKARIRLPILSEEQSIMEAINENSVTVIVGSTGSGKTTQVPQFLYEAGYASEKMIGVTEPRRIAAVSMSQRVAHEMNLSSQEVSYQIRFEGNTSPNTKIKFMTDGVLLKEIQLDPTLKKYSVIIIDEAHERSIFSDILIGILSRIIPVRLSKGKPLKLIIMSATLRVEDFTENVRLFREPKPPVMKVEARLFDVTIHYSKRTNDDYLEESFKKACKIHRQLPEGGILIFLTGVQEVNELVKKLRKTFPISSTGLQDNKKVSEFQKRRLERKEKKNNEKSGITKKILLPDIKLEDFASPFPDDADIDMSADSCYGDKSVDCELDLDDEVQEYKTENRLNPEESEQPLWVLPLYSVLPPEKQQMVFQSPPEGTRLCVISTNVAETSLTIPNIRYVVDSGKVKEKIYDKVTGVSMFHVTWTSQASANQRAGRAGRTAHGHCYRLYSSAVFNEFEKFSQAEIQRRPIDDIVLIMKSMNLPVINFPFPTPPDYLQIRSGIKRLMILGALQEKEKQSVPVQNKRKIKQRDAKDLSFITSLGRAMAAFPLAPRYGKMLALSYQHSLLPYTVALVAALTIPEVLLETPLDLQQNMEDLQRRWRNLRLSWAGVGGTRKLGDFMVLLRCVGAAEYQRGDRVWCEKNGLRHKALIEIRKLRRQLTNEINLLIPNCGISIDPQMPPPTDEQAFLLRQIVLAGLVDHVARRVDDWELTDPLDKAKWKHAYRTQDMEEPVFLPTSSVTQVDMPQWVVYQDIYETHKMFMRNVCVIDAQWLAIFAPGLCSFSPPLESPEPRYDVETDKIVCHRSAKFGSGAWEMPDVEVEYPHCHNLFRWVAYYFLTGEICSPLKAYTDYIYEPKVMVNPVAIRYREQRESLLHMLMSRDATNLSKLMTIWSAEPSYLLNEYLRWIEDKDIRAKVRLMWPPSLDT